MYTNNIYTNVCLLCVRGKLILEFMNRFQERFEDLGEKFEILSELQEYFLVELYGKYIEF